MAFILCRHKDAPQRAIWLMSVPMPSQCMCACVLTCALCPRSVGKRVSHNNNTVSIAGTALADKIDHKAAKLLRTHT